MSDSDDVVEPLPCPAPLTLAETELELQIFDGEALVARVPRSVPDAPAVARLMASAPTLLWAIQVAEIFLDASTPPRARRTSFAEQAFGAIQFATALVRGDVS